MSIAVSSMSLFKARDWWSATAGVDEAFDTGCLCVANILNKSDSYGEAPFGMSHSFDSYFLHPKYVDKIIVGSFNGVLRIYSPIPPSFQPEHLLIEAQLQDPILQLLAGKFVSYDI